MSRASELDALLTRAGYPARNGGLDDANADAVRRYAKGRQQYVAVLARRGWLTRFDLEDDFQQDAAHSAVVGDLLRCAGVVHARIADERIEGEGLLLAVELVAGAPLYTFQPTRHLSDYGELDVMLLSAQCAAESAGVAVTFVPLRTGDQTVIVAAIPDAVHDEIIDRRLVSLARSAVGEPPRLCSWAEATALIRNARARRIASARGRRGLDALIEYVLANDDIVWRPMPNELGAWRARWTPEQRRVFEIDDRDRFLDDLRERAEVAADAAVQLHKIEDLEDAFALLQQQSPSQS
jgi:hypothetical protein